VYRRGIEMKKIIKKGSVAVLIALMAFGFAGCGSGGSSDSGDKFPTFSMTDMNGNTVTESLFADNDVTVVNVWATYCGYCKQEMPDLESVYEDYKDKGVSVIGIVADGQTEEDSANSIISQYGIKYTNLITNDDFNNAFLSGVSGYPTTFFVDSDGNILETLVGRQTKDGFTATIDKYLKETTASTDTVNTKVTAVSVDGAVSAREKAALVCGNTGC